MFNAAKLKLPLLSYIVKNTVLQQALQQALKAHPKVTLRVPSSLIALHRHNNLQKLKLKSSKVIRAKLVISANGANSQVQQIAKISVHAWQYAQSCMLISVQCKNNPSNSTWQQFTPNKPRAFLPLFNNWASLVQYNSPARIRQLQNINIAQLQAEIAKHFPSRLSYVTPLAASAFPLTRRHALQYVQPGLALVSNAAHTIHPLAKQKVNLSYRNVNALINVLVNARSYSKAWASYPILKRYQMQRIANNFIMQSSINLFYAKFSNNLPPLRFMRNLKLIAAKRAGVLKRQALKYALKLQPYNIAKCVPTVGRIRRGSVASDIKK